MSMSSASSTRAWRGLASAVFAAAFLLGVTGRLHKAMGVHLNIKKEQRSQTYTPKRKMSLEPDGRFPDGIPAIVDRPILYNYSKKGSHIDLKTRHYPSGRLVGTTTNGGPLVATLMINRPKHANAIGSQTIKELLFAVESLDRELVKALILTGSGDRVTSAGGDLYEVVQMNAEQVDELVTNVHNFEMALEDAPFVTIMKANGTIRGGWLQASSATDLRVVRENQQFAQTEFKIDLPIGWGGRSRIPFLLKDSAMEPWASGEPFSGATGKEWGLFNYAISADANMDDFIHDLIGRLFEEGLGEPGGGEYLKRLYHKNLVPFESLVDERNSFTGMFNRDNASGGGSSPGQRKIRAVLDELERRKAK